MNYRSLYFLFLLAATFSLGCDDDDNGPELISANEPAAVLGVHYAETDSTEFGDVLANVTQFLDDQNPIRIIATVDHGAAAAGLGRDIDSSHLVIFGNPALGTPIMQDNQAAALDLPQKVLVYRAGDGDVVTLSNTTEYLRQRWNLDTVTNLPMIDGALRAIVGATGAEVVTPNNRNVVAGEGVVDHTTTVFSVDEVYDRVIAALADNEDVSIIAEVDHAANAASVDMTLRPTKLVIFGNPRLGSRLLLDERSIGLDLPQKILVYEDLAGTTHLVHNSADYLANRHGVRGDLVEIDQISEALRNIVQVALRQ